jgi:DNA-directed RNA polymerase specialized sigma24 family protein
MQFDGDRTGAAGSTLTSALLGEYWPVAYDRLMKALQASGIDPATAEEAAAEAATRALSRGITTDNVDDFCRWAFIVARNVARDAARHSRRLIPVDAVPDRADHYDLAGHVEVRQRWHETTDAMTSLSPFDQAVLLTSLTEDDEITSRREAVKYAVRRHRARLRLRHALGEVGAALGLHRLRRPWRWPSPEWFVAYDRLGPALLLPLVASMGLLFPADPSAPGPAVAPDPEVALAPAAASTPTTAPPTRAATSAAPRAAAPLPADAVVAAAFDGPVDSGITRGTAFRFTPSPAYERDHTVFATAIDSAGSSDSCGPANTSCPLLYKSTDGGATWALLAAKDRGHGDILLPPSYPADPRIFSAGLNLSVSTDGGETFSVLAPAAGPARMSPLFSAGDPRILFGSSRSIQVPVPTQYRDGEVGVTPARLPLPPDFLPMEFWFGPGFADDHRTFVSGVELPRVHLPTEGSALDMYRPLVYACDDSGCRLALDLGFGGALAPSLAWSQHDPGVLVVANTFGVYRSTDGGRTFRQIEVAAAAEQVLFGQVVSAPDGQLFVSLYKGGVHQLFVSHDDGATWELVHQGDGGSWGLVALPDGVLLDSRPSGPGVVCSLDGGATWLDPCTRPAARSN